MASARRLTCETLALLQITRLKARHALHFAPVGEEDAAAFAADQALAFKIGEHAIDVDRGLAGNVGDLLLSERIDHALMADVDPAALRGFAQQMRDPRG